jgi:acyl carrier protein
MREAHVDVAERVKKIIMEELNVDADQVTADASLTVDLGADELDIVQIITALGEEFDMEFPEKYDDNPPSVGELITYIEANAKDP